MQGVRPGGMWGAAMMASLGAAGESGTATLCRGGRCSRGRQHGFLDGPGEFMLTPPLSAQELDGFPKLGPGKSSVSPRSDSR